MRDRAQPLPLAGEVDALGSAIALTERGGWGNRLSTRRAHFVDAPPPHPSPASVPQARRRCGGDGVSDKVSAVIPGRCEASNPESRDSGPGPFGPSRNDKKGRRITALPVCEKMPLAHLAPLR